MRGKLLIIGGNEDKSGHEQEFSESNILKRFIDETRKKKNSKIEIITAASSIPEEVAEDYLEAFGKLKTKNVGVMIMQNREEADQPEILERLRKADAVFVTGGDQLRLTSVLGGSKFYQILKEKLNEPDFIYAGTSAGAAAASESMVLNGTSEEAPYKGKVHTSTGFAFVEDVIFDTHFISRGRIGRLFEIIVSNPKILGVGLEENTALLVHRNKMEAVGPGCLIIIDGHHIIQSNLNDVEEGAPLSIENMVLHLMSEHDIFDLKTRKLKIINPPEEEI